MFGTIDPEKVRTLLDVSALINSNYGNATSLLTQILDSSMRLTGGEAASLVLKDSASGKLRFEIALGPKGREVKKHILEPGQGIVGWVISHGTSLVVNDVENDPRFSPLVANSIGFRTKSILAVPLRVRETIVGVIEIINHKDGEGFGEDDLAWLEAFCVQAAIAIENARYLEKARDELSYLRERIQEKNGWHTLLARSPCMLEQLDLLDRIAGTESSVLILGESGVGKELFAERIHLSSHRSKGPFIRVNCATLPDGLLESELFGHVRGAFTDAIQDRAGRFEVADGGTIFLDEIGEIPLRLQAKLLRVLQQKTFERLGSSTTVSVDVRVVAATNRDIESLVQRGEFRSDLYYRLNVLPIHVPPLRERPEDIVALSDAFLRKFTHETNKKISGFTDTAMQAMLAYSWPGNVRELENAVERAVVIARDTWIEAGDLLLGKSAPAGSDFKGKTLKDALNTFKKHFLANALEAHKWNQTETAKVLDIQRTYLSRLVRELEIVNTRVNTKE